MAEDSTKVPDTLEVTKDVLAPADGPRENLVSTAVKFLHNSKVRQSSLFQKKAFLERKGLTKEEIDLAVQRAGLTDTAQLPPAHNPVYPSGPFQQALVARPPVPAPLPTVWGRARDFATTAVIVTSISYAVYRIFQVYIRPWLLGKAEDDKVRMDRLEKRLEDLQGLNEAMLQVQKTLTTIQADTATMSQRGIQSAAHAPKSSDMLLLQEVKSEVASLKGLLLSRRQFPPTPQTSPVLPSWQLTESSTAATSNGSSARQSPNSEVIQSDVIERLEGTKGDDSINRPEQVNSDSENLSMSDGISQSQPNDLKVKGHEPHSDEGDPGKDITEDQLKVDQDMAAIPATS